MFVMPTIGLSEALTLAHKALERANWASSYGEPESEYAQQTSKHFEHWVNYLRYMYPNEECNFMLDDETHFGARLPFDHGDRWERIPDSWVIVKPSGKRIITNEPRTK